VNTIYVWTSAIGGTLAPVAAGYMTTNEGWRWVWWWCAIWFAVCIVLFVFGYEETKYSYPSTLTGISPKTHNAPGVESDKTPSDSKVPSEQTKEPGILTNSDSRTPEEGLSPSLTTGVIITTSIPIKTYRQKLALWTTSQGSLKSFFRHSYQPAQILFTIPAVFYMSLDYGVTNAWRTIMVTILSSTMTYPPYNFDASQIGFMNVAAFVGGTIGALVIGPLSDWSILYLARRNKGIYEPEMRLWMMAPFVPFVPAGALMFGIGLNNGLSWPIVAVGYGLTGFGLNPVSSVALTYITDSYTEVSMPLPLNSSLLTLISFQIVGDSLVGVTFTRNIISTALVFALTPWIEAMGIQNVIVIITVIAAVVFAFVFVFIFYGKKFRVWTTARYRYYA
jgi:MFS family permease